MLILLRDFFKISDYDKETGKNSIPTLSLQKSEVKNIHSFPLISIIIPTYQEEKILERTLSSYPKELRTKFNIELIVSDGGSNDKTLLIAGKYADKIAKHEKSSKQTIAEGRNAGANISSGKILVFINADTVPNNPEYFFNSINHWYFGTNGIPGCDAIACKVYVAPEEIIFKDKIFYALHNFYVKLINSLGLGMGRGECQIIKSEVFNKVQGYKPNIAAGEDFDLYRRIAKHGTIKFIDSLVVLESPRRFRRYGYLKVLWQWVINSISVIFCGRSVSDEWEAVR